MKSFFSLKGIVLILSILFSILTIYAARSASFSNSLAFITILYVICLIYTYKKIELRGPGIITIYLICFFRYTVTIYSQVSTNTLSQIANNYAYLDMAVFMMILEMLCVFGTMCFVKQPALYSEFNGNHIQGKKTKLLLFISFLLIAYLGYINRSTLGNFSILSEESEVDDANFDNVSGLTSIVWQALLAFVYAVILVVIRTRGGSSAIYKSLLCCLLYVIVIFTGQANISRWYTIVTMTASIAFLFRNYPNKKKQVLIYAGIPAVFLLIIATILKNTIVGLNAGFENTFAAIFNPTNMDTYFAGPVGVNNAIGATAAKNISISSLYYDIFNNFPYLSHVIDRNQASVNLYNLYLDRGDQIIPLLGQSYAWFGKLFCPLLSIVIVIITAKADAMYKKSTGIFEYLWAFIAIWCGIAIILNMTIWISWFYSRIIPAFIIYRLGSKQQQL